MILDAEAGGRALFDETFAGNLPLLPTWEVQPDAFQKLFRNRAVRIACATLHTDLPEDLDADPTPAELWLAEAQRQPSDEP